MSENDWDSHRLMVVQALERQERKLDELGERVLSLAVKAGIASIFTSMLASALLTFLVQTTVRKLT
jgi:hypothetical protein